MVSAAIKLKNTCSLEGKPMTNLDSILKSRDITLPANTHLIKALVFPVVMYKCETWIIKKAECWRIDAFTLWYWRRFLRVPLDCKDYKPANPKGNQTWISIGRTDAEGEYPILWPILMQRASSLEKILMLGKIEEGTEGAKRGWDGWMASPTQSTWLWANSGRW